MLLRQILLASLERTSIPNELERTGFVRRTMTWRRFRDGVVHLIEFQIASFSEPANLRFTVNLGAALADVWRIYRDGEMPSTVRESDCLPRFRVGEALAGFRSTTDLWWTLRESESDERLLGEVQSSVLGVCLPILNRLNSTGEVHRFVRDKYPLRYSHPASQIQWAVVCHLAGAVEDARNTLLELEANPRLNADWRTRIQHVRIRLAQVSR